MKKAANFINRFNLMMPIALFVIVMNAMGVFGQLTKEESFFELSGGKIRCTGHLGFGGIASGAEVDKPENKLLCKTATDAFDGAAVLVFGQTLELRFYTYYNPNE